MADQQEIALLKECHELEKEINKRGKKLNSLASSLSWGDMYKNRPKRYSVDLDFIPPPVFQETQLDAIAALEFLQPSTESFVVDAATNFYCTSIESSVRFTGATALTLFGQGLASTVVAGQPATLTLGYGVASPDSGQSSAFGLGATYRMDYFTFDWEFRDTGSDREWSSGFIPEVFLCSGRLSPCMLPVPGRMKGGSEIEVTVDPILNAPARGIFFMNVDNFESFLEKITVQISFHGYERIL